MIDSGRRLHAVVIVALLAIVVVGGWLRLTDLGRGTMGADVMEFYKVSVQEVAPAELISNSSAYLGRMPPLWFAAHNAFLQWTGLPVTFQTMRIPDAVVGTLTILMAFLLLQLIHGNVAGLIAALLTAFQPLMIQMSRECYFYAPLVLGCCMGLWAVLRLTGDLQQSRRPGLLFYAGLVFSFLLVTHVQISTWAFAGVMGVTIYILLVMGAVKKKISWMPIGVVTGIFLIVGVPTLLFEWGMADVMSLMFGEGKDQWTAVFEKDNAGLVEVIISICSGYLFGQSLVRGAVTLLILIAGCRCLICDWKHSAVIRCFVLFSAGACSLLLLIHTLSVFPPSPRHYSSIYPMLLVVITLGVMQIGHWVGTALRRERMEPVLQIGLGLLLALGMNGRAAWWSTKLVGQPPYHEIAQWMDAHLPAGTVVLCDRWFTPWNEFRINAPEKVYCTFTVPNEPVQVFQQVNWRETAKQFFAINPRAAFYEGKEYWDQLGPWTWPAEHFAHKQVFWDEAASELDALGLNYRPVSHDYPEEWKGVTVYYNLEEDIVAQAKAAGRRLLPLFGAEWTYTKTQDHRDWYVMGKQAEVDVYNLTDAPLEVDVELIGTPVNSAKRLTMDGKTAVNLQPNQLQRIRMGRRVFEPGKNRLVLLDLDSGNAPLLVQQIRLNELAE